MSKNGRFAIFNRFFTAFRGADDVSLFARVVLLSFSLRLAVRLTSPAKIVVRLDRASRRSGSLSLSKAVRYADFVTGFKRLAPGACLIRSLILFRLFRRHDLPTSIHFGLSKDQAPAKGLVGHSWVCLDGAPVMEAGRPTEKYEVLFSYPIEGGVTVSA